MQIIGPACTLGEGPLWHPKREELFWFDIPKGEMHVCNTLGDQHQTWQFGEPASAAGWIDENTLLVATASALLKFNITTGERETVVSMEAENPLTRSNDGRIGPDGSFWIGTMANDATPRAGTYYRFDGSKLITLLENISIPNATCFSPDGKTAYLSDTRKQIIWRWALNEVGAPVGDKEIHINLREENINPDGAVCDAEGYLWNAQWGASRVTRYAPDGTLDQVLELPVSQPTCPAFGGPELKTLFITSARQGLPTSMLESEPDAGKLFVFDVGVQGLKETCAIA